MKAWTLVSPQGSVYGDLTREKRADVRDAALDWLWLRIEINAPLNRWRALRREGWRIVRVTITEGW